MRATKAVIHHENFLHNLRQIRTRIAPETRICVPVKADAYGHGAIAIAKTAVADGITHLAVATAREGMELRKANIECHILLLGPPDSEDANLAVSYDLEMFVTNTALVDNLAETARKAGKRARVHIKIDTGMGRIGCRPEEALDLAKKITSHDSLILAGTATHLAVSDSPAAEDCAYTELQLDRFEQAINSIRESGIDPGIVHAANSGGVLLHPRSRYDMIRPGIIAYGYLPDESITDSIDLKPVMEFKAGIIEKHILKKGESVSYGRIWQTERDTVIAVVSAGYADGLMRKLSPGLSIWISGESYPVVGRICMDLCMVDLGPGSQIPVGTEVSIFGPDPNPVSAAGLARILETIPYEITCGIGKRVPRIKA